jgi:flagellar hook-associated protein 1 FlgK
MTTGLLGIGSSALDAAYTALQTAGNNIANANTPGYSREVVSFSPNVSSDLGGIYLGTGVQATAISRIYSDFLGAQTNQAQAAASQADTAATLTGQVNSLFSDSTTGLGASIDNFFTQIQALTTNPGSAATRQTTLAAAQQMAGQFNGYYAQLQSMSQSAQSQLAGQISTVNQTVSQIASLNDQISLATATGQQPNSLLDQRDQDILTLNKAIGITTTTQSNGAVDLYVANGQPLLIGDKTYTMAMGQDPMNPQNLVVGTTTGGAINALQAGSSVGGAIGALLQFQSQTIPGVENQIGQLAVTLSSQMNSLQKLGTDQNGAAGTNMFSQPSAIPVIGATTNAVGSTLSASYSNFGQLQAASYTLSRQGGTYTLTNLSDGSQTTYASLPVTAFGMTLSGSMASGDVFTIEPVQQGANNLSVAIGSGSQIAAASPVQATVGASNAGTLVVGNLGLQPLSSSQPIATQYGQLQDPVTLNFTSPTQFTYTDAATGVTSAAQTYTAGSPINVNGWSLTLTGTPAAGDSVAVAPGASGTGDARNASLMAQLQNQAIAGGATLDQAYASTIAGVGSLASTANATQASATAQLQNATTQESSVSGVNLNEEASSLLQFQQQYQAAAQMITASNTIFSARLTDINAS